MEAWPFPPVPRLPGAGLPLRLFDTASSEVRATNPGWQARMYVCGITPYDATHLGHAFTYLAFDLVNRVWRDAGHDVHYVQNVTDVDDPLLERAVATGQDWVELARRETALFREDMTALRILPPADYIGAVESIPYVARLVQVLQDKGAVYPVEQDLYFEVGADPRFGAVSGLDRQRMVSVFAERGGDPDRPGKRDPLDCLLWQSARPDEPAWETDLGHGRPGWHIECTAIALEHLGMSFDVQGGGSDLAFPHHEMGASEAHVITGEWPYARSYVHSGMVGLDGEKMSKSRGNLVFVSRLRADGTDSMAVRLALLGHHYRSDWQWSPADLESAEERLDRWRMAVAAAAGPSAEPVVSQVRSHLADDLDAPRALATVDRWVREVELAHGDDPAAPGQVRDLVDALLGVDLAS
ncbi:MAG TPA: cysteine--1-D-myo-inosityl 2-amino-2-deoxy-alpha-D-glucopyranoside ligase [Actinomycetes bacterium]|nr:cysteine--1-D-myo-inosityl 2-amino-2-deoxy-alpha-D-glucopyranoside ligase [Actinomycetes bacterium]